MTTTHVNKTCTEVINGNSVEVEYPPALQRELAKLGLDVCNKELNYPLHFKLRAETTQNPASSTETDQDRLPQTKLENARIAFVGAHPDDSQYAAGTLYHLIHHKGAKVDSIVITNGRSGHGWSELASPIYNGLPLTDKEVASKAIPRIRMGEEINAAQFLGIENVFFLGEDDNGGTPVEKMLNEKETVWNIEKIQKFLQDRMDKGKYDYVFVVLPNDDEHGHHKAATILTLQAIQSLPEEQRPVVLGASMVHRGQSVSTCSSPEKQYSTLKDHPITAVAPDTQELPFDRNQSWGDLVNPRGIGRWRGKYDYNKIARHHIGLHMTQAGSLDLPLYNTCERFRVLGNISSKKFGEVYLEFLGKVEMSP